MKRHFLIAACLCAQLSLFAAAPLSAVETDGLRAGVARIEITPEKPVTMSGYAARKGFSTGVHDPLSARVLAFEAAGRRLVLVSADLIGFYSGTADYMREALLGEFHLQPAELFLAGIHTHAGPALTISESGAANNLEYTRTLKDKLLEVTRQALDNLEPVRLGLGIGSCPVGANRRQLQIDRNGRSAIVLGRNTYGPTDKEVLVMRVNRADGTLKAVAFDYATHATCLGGKNYTISGDVLGLAEQFVEKILGPDVVAPVFAGASGNINPWFRALESFNTEPGWIPEPVLLGTFLGEEVVHVCRAIDRTDMADRMSTAMATLQLPAKPPEDSTAGTKASPGTVPLNVTVARLGDIAFVGLGAEVCTEIGLAIKAGSPCPHTFVIAHCNGAASYIAPKELHVQGGYEIRSSPFAPQAADILVHETIRMLHDL
jgi:neutral ceramidase